MTSFSDRSQKLGRATSYTGTTQGNAKPQQETNVLIIIELPSN